MVVTTSLIDMLVLSMIYDVSRRLQRELNSQLSPVILLPYFCGHSKEWLILVAWLKVFFFLILNIFLYIVTNVN